MNPALMHGVLSCKCGNSELVVVALAGTDGIYVECRTCKSQGIPANTIKQAIKYWQAAQLLI